MRDEDREWLENLHKELNEYNPPSYNRGRKTSYGSWSEKRSLTPEEWKRLTKLCDKGEGITCSLGTRYGFTLQLAIYEDAPFPGTLPQFLVFIDQKQLPEDQGTTGATLGGAGDSWEKAWDIFTRWTHSEKNAAKLSAQGMPPPQGKSHYQY